MIMNGERCVAVSAGTYLNEFECVLEIEAVRGGELAMPESNATVSDAPESISESLPLVVV